MCTHAHPCAPMCTHVHPHTLIYTHVQPHTRIHIHTPCQLLSTAWPVHHVEQYTRTVQPLTIGEVPPVLYHQCPGCVKCEKHIPSVCAACVHHATTLKPPTPPCKHPPPSTPPIPSTHPPPNKRSTKTPRKPIPPSPPTPCTYTQCTTPRQYQLRQAWAVPHIHHAQPTAPPQAQGMQPPQVL